MAKPSNVADLTEALTWHMPDLPVVIAVDNLLYHVEIVKKPTTIGESIVITAAERVW